MTNDIEQTELVYGFTPESALTHLELRIRQAKQSNRSFLWTKLGLYLRGNFRSLSRLNYAMTHRRVIWAMQGIVRQLKKYPDGLSASDKKALSKRCQALADTMQCIDAESSWESGVLMAYSELLNSKQTGRYK